MGSYYVLVSNPPTNIQNIAEEQNLSITEVQNPYITEVQNSYITEVQNPIITEVHNPIITEAQNLFITEEQKETTNDEGKTSMEKTKIMMEYSGNRIWHSGMDKDLIRLIKQEECLWNVTCNSYKHKKYKWDALERVANEMKRLWPKYKDICTIRKCCAKFRNLRTYYQRERKKQLNNERRKLPHGVRWIHFDDLSFINASDSLQKFQNAETNHSPIIIQFSSDNRDTSRDENEESVDSPGMLEQGNSSSAEDQMPHEDQNGCSELEKNSPKAKKKLLKIKVGTASSSGVSKTSKTTNFKSSKLKGTAPKPKNTEQRITRLVPVNSNLFSKPQTVEINHDDAFANFIAKDLGKIPEGKQKEQLRFKILELIHRCKMDAKFMPD